MEMHESYSVSVLTALLRSDFRAFVEKCFVHLNPGQMYHDNWHVGVIAHALAGCLEGKTKRLVILLPPRNLKSTIVSIAWPAFVLGHFPSMKFVCASYSQDLAHKLSNDTRSIMISDWYRELFPGTTISSLKDTQQVFETTQHGGRFATSVGGPLTGFGGDIVIVDDPQKPIDMAHESSRHKARDWLFNTAISRFNSQKDGILIIVMQRLHEDDLVGNIEHNPDFTVLKIPARAEEDLAFHLDADTRLLFRAGSYQQKDRFGPMEFEAQRKAMGSRDFSAQYQQNPLPLDGGLFNIEWFPLCEKVPQISELIMSVDVAATSGGGNYTAVTLWGHLDHQWYLIAAHRFQFDAAKVRQEIVALDKHHRPDLVVIDSDGIGKSLVSELQFQGFKHIYPSSSRLSKLQRAEQIVSMIEGGRVWLLATAPKLAEFQREIISFPNGKYDDFVDSMTQVLRFESGAVKCARLHKRVERRVAGSKNAYSTAISVTAGGRIVRYI
jgi:predicted phage terminase large subunit-like protein